MNHTFFGGINSRYDLHLITINQEVQPAEPKLRLVEIPGADGSIDLTEALGAGVLYNDRELTWTFGTYPDDDWTRKRSEVSGALNGKNFQITFSDDPDYYYTGRVQITEHATDTRLHTISAKAICRPYKLKKIKTKVTRDVTTTLQELILKNDRMEAYATITRTGGVFIARDGELIGGSEIKLTEGPNVLDIYTLAGNGTVTFEWQEGAL